MDKQIKIEDFTEEDFSNPIKLLKALNNFSSRIVNVDTVPADGLLTFSEVVKKYNVSSDYLLSALLTGELLPTKVTISFNPDDIERFISNDVSRLLTSFDKELEKMPMNYSYKPLLILSLLNSSSFSANIEEIIDFFFNFYLNRKKSNKIVEKGNSSFVVYQGNRLIARRTLLRYPINVLSQKRFVSYDKETDTVFLNPLLICDISSPRVSIIKKRCCELLDKYYNNL